MLLITLFKVGKVGKVGKRRGVSATFEKLSWGIKTIYTLSVWVFPPYPPYPIPCLPYPMPYLVPFLGKADITRIIKIVEGNKIKKKVRIYRARPF